MFNGNTLVPQIDTNIVGQLATNFAHNRAQRKHQNQVNELSREAFDNGVVNEDALLELNAIDPRAAGVIIRLQNENKNAELQQIQQQNNEVFNITTSLLQESDPSARRARIGDLAQEAQANGKNPQRYLDLLNLDDDHLTARLRNIQVQTGDFDKIFKPIGAGLTAEQRNRQSNLTALEGAFDERGRLKPRDQLTAAQEIAAIDEGLLSRAVTDAKVFGDRKREEILAVESTGTGQAELEKKQLTVAQARKKLDDDLREQLKIAAQQDFEASTAIANINKLLNGGFEKIFGIKEGRLPDLLRSQEAADLIAIRNQVVGLISLDSRQKLKGQGEITDQEALTLEESATILSNPLISAKLAREELLRVREIFARKKIAPSSEVSQPAQVLRFDSQGNLIQ